MAGETVVEVVSAALRLLLKLVSGRVRSRGPLSRSEFGADRQATLARQRRRLLALDEHPAQDLPLTGTSGSRSTSSTARTFVYEKVRPRILLDRFVARGDAVVGLERMEGRWIESGEVAHEGKSAEALRRSPPIPTGARCFRRVGGRAGPVATPAQGASLA